MDWKTAVDTRKPQNLWFEVEGRMIHAHQWLEDDRHTLVFIHGSMSNNIWWQPIASQIPGTILSIDLSGHGQSAWDDTYGVAKHAAEVASMLSQYGKGKVYVVAHSYGGYVAGYAATLVEIEKIALIDTPLHFEKRGVIVRNQLAVYPTKEAAIQKFKPLPHQPIQDPKLVTWIAERSIKPVENGYTWQFDPRTLNRTFSQEVIDIIKKGLYGKAEWWYGEHSPFLTEEALSVASSLDLAIHKIPGAYHAIMLDAPELLKEKIETMIESRS